MEKLGVELPLLLTQIVNFAVLLVILTKLLYKPILTGLRERRKKIEEGLAFTEKAKREEEKLTKRQEEVLQDARDEARQIIENAKKDAKRVKEEIIVEGKSEVEALKERQEKELKSRLEELEAQVSRHTVDIASEMVKRLLGDLITTDDQHRIIRKQLERLERSHEKRS